MDSKRYQVFISSTYADLVKERHEIATTLQKAGHIPTGMELFPPADKSAWEVIKGVIEECDYYMIIIGFRYGSTVTRAQLGDHELFGSDRVLSYTCLEYRFAKSLGKPILALIRRPSPAGRRVAEDNPRRLEALRRAVRENRTVGMWQNIADLKDSVRDGLKQLIGDRPERGWVRGVNTLAPLPGRFRLSLMGPLSGLDSPFGWSQARSVVAALIRVLNHSCGIDWRYWRDRFHVTLIDTSRLSPRDGSLEKAYRSAHQESRVIFGPMDSDEVVSLFGQSARIHSQDRKKSARHRPLNKLNHLKIAALQKYTILTTAATAIVRDHDAPTEFLLQLSPNVEVYAEHLADFVDNFFPEAMPYVVIGPCGEYGDCSAQALAKYTRRRVVRATYPRTRSERQGSAVLASVETFEQLFSRQGSNPLFVIADTGERLKVAAGTLRDAYAPALIATMSSLDDSALQDKQLDGMYSISSFAPSLYSLNLSDFLRSLEHAQSELEKDYGPRAWNAVSSVDAETHDAAVHWLTRCGVYGIQGLGVQNRRQLFVTNPNVLGTGNLTENRAALHMFKIVRDKMKLLDLSTGLKSQGD